MERRECSIECSEASVAVATIIPQRPSMYSARQLAAALMLLFLIPSLALAQAGSVASPGSQAVICHDGGHMPEFPGGQVALVRYLRAHLQYPKTAQPRTGRVYVRFIIDSLGYLHDAKVMKGLGRAYDEEAVRVVMSLPRFKPARQADGKPYTSYYNLPIVFDQVKTAERRR